MFLGLAAEPPNLSLGAANGRALMETYDFDAEAVLFFRPAGKGRNHPLTIRRFSRTCEAILFAVEQLPVSVRKGCSIEADDLQLTGGEIFKLYDSPDFPLHRIK